MKTHFMQISLGLLSMALLSACTTIQPLTPSTTESTLPAPSPTSMLLPTVTITQPAQLPPTPTHTLAAISLCPPATADVVWECRESAPGSTRICSATAAFDAVWRCYEDLDFAFALALPPDMQAAITINTPASDPLVIQRRHTLSHPLMGGIDMDIWLTAEADLEPV